MIWAASRPEGARAAQEAAPAQAGAEAASEPAAGATTADSTPAGAATTAALPEGTNAPVALGAADGSPGLRLRVHGFVQGELALAVYDVADTYDYDLSFLVREAEVDLELPYGERAGARLELNVLTDSIGAGTTLPASRRSLAEEVIEQAYVYFRAGGLTLTAGQVSAPLGLEPLDPVDRLTLTRAHLALLARPTLVTGAVADYRLADAAGLFVFVSNGWDLPVDHNRSKSFGAGLSHRGLGLEGKLALVVGKERQEEESWRWLADYAVTHRTGGLSLALELLYGAEQGLGRSGTRIDPDLTARWWGGIFAAEWEPEHSRVPLRAGVRLEYLHDHDLALGLPAYPTLPPLTTLVGTTAALRHRIARGLELAAEYRVDFQRGDREGVSVHRNESIFPRLWNIVDWYVTQQASVAFVAAL